MPKNPIANAFYLDGILVTSTYFGSRPGIANQVSQDATYELQTYPVGATVEWGHSAGGGFNAAIALGETSFTARSTAMSASPPWAQPADSLWGRTCCGKQNQEGASVGGPIWPHKVFFFANTEF